MEKIISHRTPISKIENARSWRFSKPKYWIQPLEYSLDYFIELENVPDQLMRVPYGTPAWRLLRQFPDEAMTGIWDFEIANCTDYKLLYEISQHPLLTSLIKIPKLGLKITDIRNFGEQPKHREALRKIMETYYKKEFEPKPLTLWEKLTKTIMDSFYLLFLINRNPISLPIE